MSKKQKSLHNSIPQLPKNIQELVVKYLPILAVLEIIPTIIFLVGYRFAGIFEQISNFVPLTKAIGLVSILPVAIILAPINFGSQLLGYGSIPVNDVHRNAAILVTVLFGLIFAYLLFKRKKVAWFLLCFVIIILGVIATFSVNILEIIISLLGLYILLQIRSYYKN